MLKKIYGTKMIPRVKIGRVDHEILARARAHTHTDTHTHPYGHFLKIVYFNS